MTNWFSSLIDIEFLDRIKRKKKSRRSQTTTPESWNAIPHLYISVLCSLHFQLRNAGANEFGKFAYCRDFSCDGFGVFAFFFRKFNIPGVFDHWNDFNTDLSRSMRSLNVTSVPPTKYFVKQKNGFNVYITVSIIFRRIFFRTKIIEFRHDDYFQCNIFKMLNDLRLYKWSALRRYLRMLLNSCSFGWKQKQKFVGRKLSMVRQ